MNIVNYVVGCLLWLPTFFALCVDDLSVLFVGLLWGLFLWNSPKISLKAKRFWRQFHKTNFQILNLIK